MNFRINLRPSPAASYFTVQEHLRRKEKYDLKMGTDSVKQKPKEILGISARMAISFFCRSTRVLMIMAII
jgi:hypothetical protein